MDQFCDRMSSLSLDLFKLPPFQLSLNLGDPINIEIFKTIRSQLILPSCSQIHQLIRVSIPVFSLQLGAPSTPYHYLFTTYCQVRSWPHGTSRMPIVPYHFTALNGHPQWCTWERTPLQSTQPCALEPDHQWVCMVRFAMRLLTYCGLKASDLSPVGSMTTSSFASPGLPLRNTTDDRRFGTRIS